MISVISWMILFGAKLLPIEDGILVLAGVSIVAELTFEILVAVIVAEYKKFKQNPNRPKY